MKIVLALMALMSPFIVSAQGNSFTEYVVIDPGNPDHSGWLMTGETAPLVTGGMMLPASRHKLHQRLKEATAMGMIAAGTTRTIRSIPLLTLGSKSHAIKLTLKKEKFPKPTGVGYRLRSRPAVALRFEL
jgi:hypothetical protein